MTELLHFPMGEIDKAKTSGKLQEYLRKTLVSKYGKASAELMETKVKEEVEKALEHWADNGNGVKVLQPKPRPPHVNRLTLEVEPPQNTFKVGFAHWTQEIKI